jgi:hypothetical protein
VEILLLGMLGAGAAWAFQRVRSPRHRALRAAEKVPISKIRDLRAGQIGRITGKVAFHGDPLVAPLSRRECILYSTLLYRSYTSENADQLMFLGQDTREQDFLVDDGERRVLVRVHKAFRDGDLDTFTPQLHRIPAWLQARGEPVDNPEYLRAQESGLSEGARVTVCGLVDKEIDPAGDQPVDYREAPTRLILAWSPKQPLVIIRE